MNPKMMLRKKAMESMMAEEGPSLPMKKKPMPGQEGMESMMVTPEEKAMIMEMRGDGENESKEEAAEVEQEEI